MTYLKFETKVRIQHPIKNPFDIIQLILFDFLFGSYQFPKQRETTKQVSSPYPQI